MGLFGLIKEVATLGGHGVLENAQRLYQSSYEQYQKKHSLANASKNRADAELEKLGKETQLAMETLRRSYNLLKLIGSREDQRNARFSSAQNSSQGLTRAENAISRFDSSVSVATGMGLGSVTAASSWALVSLAGAASTGTSISALSGVAAYNATMAWFGGGALAAGGAGMAGGALALTGIALVPMIAFGAWSTRTKAKEVDEARLVIESEMNEIESKIQSFNAFFETVVNSLKVLKHAHLDLQAVEWNAKKVVCPNGFASSIFRSAKSMFGKQTLSGQQIQALSLLEEEVQQFSMLFSK